ncbi:MAG: coproporphyrinogen III oxidase [Epsilonproteobacteria bacterium]|nr:MAG: coproporphyrinogen III oxidase [Campylobacterota bacterium]
MNISAQSEEAKEVNLLFSGLQVYFVSKLNALALQFGEGKSCKSVMWECDKGKHGGGKRYDARDKTLFNQASVDVSQIHYEDRKNKALECASVFSVTIHPDNPHVPSLHLSVSWEKMKEEKACWHIMADFNPPIINEAALDQNIFSQTVKKSVGRFYEEGIINGDTYFYIPVLRRHRGVSHLYLENYSTGNFEEQKAFILAFYESVMDCYLSIFSAKLMLQPTYTEEKKEEQLAYHTLYLFQVLTEDRGTRTALLEHDKNDVGILASLPSHINRDILSLWGEKMPAPQDLLLKQILKVLPKAVPTPVDEKCKKLLANTIRKHYKKYPIE